MSYDPWGAPTEYSATGTQQTIGIFAGSPGQGLFLLFGGMLYDAAAGIYLTKSRGRAIPCRYVINDIQSLCD
ncbi:MAG: hypothetical protein ACYC51_03700 [Thermoleophilia bacterium]